MTKLIGSYRRGDSVSFVWQEVDNKGWINPNPVVPQVGDIVSYAPRGWERYLPEGIKAEYHAPVDHAYNKWGKQPSVAGLLNDYYKLVAN